MPISRTSIWAAAARAFGAREPDAGVRNPDWLAERLLGPEERSLLTNHSLITALEQPYQEATKSMEIAGSARMLIARTRFIDERLEAALHDGIRQLVILGAGFDTRAYRFADLLRDAHVIEVDQQETQRLKINRIKEVRRLDSRSRHIRTHRLYDNEAWRCSKRRRFQARSTNLFHLGGSHHVSTGRLHRGGTSLDRRTRSSWKFDYL